MCSSVLFISFLSADATQPPLICSVHPCLSFTSSSPFTSSSSFTSVHVCPCASTSICLCSPCSESFCCQVLIAHTQMHAKFVMASKAATFPSKPQPDSELLAVGNNEEGPVELDSETTRSWRAKLSTMKKSTTTRRKWATRGNVYQARYSQQSYHFPPKL